MEKVISHNLGRPSIINDDDIAVHLPPKKPGLIKSSSGANLYDIFQDQIKLAIIESRIYSELYSASSQTKSGIERMKVLGKLDSHLQRWRDSIPVHIRPEHPIKCSDEQYIPVVMMHFTYLDAVIMLHRVSIRGESVKGSEVKGVKTHGRRMQMNPRVYASQLLCLSAARRSIELLDTFDKNNLHNQHLTWLALYYPLSASLVLFANILSNPQYQHAASDIRLMNVITSFISHSIQPGSSFAATPTLNVINELYSIATRLVARVPQQTSQKMKSPHEFDEDAKSDFTSSPGIRLAPDGSLGSELNAETPRLLAPNDAVATLPNIDLLASNPVPAYSGQKPAQGYTDIQSTTSATVSQESSANSPLEFAPFIPLEESFFNDNLTIYGSMLSPTRFEWDMANMWMPSSASDPFVSADPTGLPAEVDVDYGGGYFNVSEDGDIAYYQ